MFPTGTECAPALRAAGTWRHYEQSGGPGVTGERSEVNYAVVKCNPNTAKFTGDCKY